MDSAKNKWYVITGGPCSGKTTVHLLAARGYKTTIEEARHYLNAQRHRGKTVEQARKNYREFQLSVLELQKAQEASLSPEDTVFLDRAVPDARAYYRLYRIPEDLVVTEAILAASYRKVFILKRLPLVHDYARIENKEAQATLERLIADVYRELGFPLIEVPVMFPEQRVDFILKNL